MIMTNPISPALIKCLVKNNGITLAQKELETILNRDIHDKSIGCKISNTHIRIGKVHLDTFYEAQLLFGNAYWTDVFAYYLYNHIVSIVNENKYNKTRPIILYGYETYSTLTLNKTVALLQESGFIARLRVYEVKGKRIRYNDENIVNNDNKDQQLIDESPIILFFVGISSTLSTFSYMNKALCQLNENYEGVEKFCASIIQVVGKDMGIPDCNDVAKKFIGLGEDKLGKYVVGNNLSEEYLSFIPNFSQRKVYHYVSVRSSWHIPEECKLCMPDKNYLLEQPLIEVNEASVVPTQMIRLNEFQEQACINDPIKEFSLNNTETFLNDISNCEYLHYDHIERNNNHFQYYFRLSRLYHDKKEEIEKWLAQIKRRYDLLGDKRLNVIVAPQHYSNAGFVDSVNNIVFEGTAHVIEFDLQKEYRSNFKAKYNNYSELEKIIRDINGYTINFYYVNDQIISGTAYYRTKSLINSLFSQIDSNRLKVFSGIFVLLNRNSFDTRKSYINVEKCKVAGNESYYLPYFSYLNIEIPSLRSYDDSCPLCFENKKSLEIIDECALDSSVLFWQEKILFHRMKSIYEARKLKSDRDTYYRHFRRLQCENDLWIAVKNAYKKISDNFELELEKIDDNYKRNIIINTFYECIKFRLDATNDIQMKVEYLISYLKVMSRALLYYQEDVKRASLYILLKIFDFFSLAFDKYTLSQNFCFPTRFPIGDNYITLDFNQKALVKLRCDLFKIVITRLCAIGSCVLLKRERLLKCREMGNYMHSCTEGYNYNFDAFLLNNIKKLLCYDRGDSKAILLNNALWDNGNKKLFDSDVFFAKLYLENVRYPLIAKNESVVKQIKEIGDSDITQKYISLSRILKTECLKYNDSIMEIQFFTSNGVNITDGNISSPSKSVDFIFDEENCVYYVRIGNNFDSLRLLNMSAQENFEQILESELKIVKNANIIVGIKTKTIQHVSIILRYRKEIMEIVQSDFNNDAIPKLILTRGEAKMLSEIKTVTHTHKPLQEFENIFNLICSSNNEENCLKLQSEFLSLYMDTVISIAYREKLRFEEYKFSSLDREGSMFSVSYNIVGDRLLYAEKLIKRSYPDICLNIGKMNGDEFIAYDPNRQKTIKDQFKDNYMIIRFRNSEEIGEAYMLIKTFVDNAYRHCMNPKVLLRLIDDGKGNFDLNVENTIPEKKASPADKGITLTALEYIFNGQKTEEKRLFINSPNEQLVEKGNFKIIFKGFIKKIN